MPLLLSRQLPSFACSTDPCPIPYLHAHARARTHTHAHAHAHAHKPIDAHTQALFSPLLFWGVCCVSWEAGYTFSKQRHFELQYLPARPSQKPRQMELNLIETMAAAGNLDAMHMLGESLYKGTNSFKQSPKMAYRYFIRSKAVPKSALRLGLMHLHGNGAEQNDNMAKLYFEAAVKKESRRGDALLATMYIDGRGTATNYTKALFFANRSAHSGDTIGVVTLGTMYSRLGLSSPPPFIFIFGGLFDRPSQRVVPRCANIL